MFNLENNLWIVTLSDISYTVFFVCFIIYFTVIVPRTVKELKGKDEKAIPQVKDYAIMISDI